MKKFYFLFLMFIYAQFAEAATSVPLDFNTWDFISNQGGTASSEIITDGIKFYGSGYRQGTIAIVKEKKDFSNAVIYYKWKANGMGSFLSHSSGLGIWDNNTQQFTKIIDVGWFTNESTYLSSILVENDVWYYTRLVITPDRKIVAVTCTIDYDDNGGQIFYTRNAEINNDALWQQISNCSIYVVLNDNYSVEAYKVIGEVKYIVNKLIASTFIASQIEGGGVASGIVVKEGENEYYYAISPTSNPIFPVPLNGYDTTFNGGQDVLIVKMTNDLTTLVSATYIGG